MFRGCTSLTTAPTLQATTLAASCYYAMFQDCTSLTAAPTLPATTLEQNCYYGMFSGCTSLTTAPALQATTLAASCYNNMFKGCTSLKIGPDIKATATASGSLVSMFNGCTSLCMITTNMSTVTSTHMASWVVNVSPTGDFFNLGGATFATGNSGIPTGWTEHMFRIKDTVLTPATGTEYSVTANVEWSPSLTWTSADIIISDSDSGAGTRSATLTFTPGEVVNGVLTPANNIDINFQDPDTWFELIVYNNGTVVDTQYVSYTTL